MVKYNICVNLVVAVGISGSQCIIYLIFLPGLTGPLIWLINNSNNHNYLILIGISLEKYIYEPVKLS
ncbi:hypothetical protein evm_015392 [Chilo suppressalis]|nr:hypothetical protein evm_015392 [Chilo suppressalis]